MQTQNGINATFSGATLGEVISNMRKFLQAYETRPIDQLNGEGPTPVKKATATKAVKAAPIEPEEELDLGIGEEPSEPQEIEERKFDLKADIIPGFRAYVKRNSAKDAQTILARFKAKSVNDLKVKDYAKVMELIG